MSHTLGIIIKEGNVPDTQAKIIGYMCMGLKPEEIELVTTITTASQRTMLCTLRGILGIPNNYDLLVEAHISHYDFEGRVDGKDLFTTQERAHLYKKFPRLLIKRNYPL